MLSINEVALRWARLVYWDGWLFGVQLPVHETYLSIQNNHSGQLSLAIPPWVGTIEYQPKGGDPLWLVSVSVAGKTVWSPN